MLVSNTGYELVFESSSSCTQVVLGFYLNSYVFILFTLTVAEKPLSFSEAVLSIVDGCFSDIPARPGGLRSWFSYLSVTCMV